MRISTMEVLGFTETPSTSFVRIPPTAPSRLVSTTERTGLTVAEMWNTTELQADSMADWRPVDVDEKKLNKRVRWPLMVMLLAIVTAFGAGAFWIWQAPDNAAQAALETVKSDAEILGKALVPLEAATASLVPGQSIDVTAISDAIIAVDEASRALFSSSGELAASASSNRSTASDAATQALDASKTLSGLTAYLGAITPVMVAPTLITDPGLIDLETAIRDFGEWRNQFDTVRVALPEGTMTVVTQELTLVSGKLESIQNAYIDGLRDDDRQAALAAVRELEGVLSTTWSVLLHETDAVKQAITARIESARSSLLLLAG